jgi:hypothetical protein
MRYLPVQVGKLEGNKMTASRINKDRVKPGVLYLTNGGYALNTYKRFVPDASSVLLVVLEMMEVDITYGKVRYTCLMPNGLVVDFVEFQSDADWYWVEP